MNLVLIVQIVFLFVIFIVTLLCVVLPMKIVPRDPNKQMGPRGTRILSFSNCLSGGVFMGTCFLQLVPYIEIKFIRVLEDILPEKDYARLLTQTSVVIGFFIILLIEQCVKKCQHGRGGSGDYITDHQELSNVIPHLVDGEDSDDEDSDHDKKILLDNGTVKTHRKHHNGEVDNLGQGHSHGAHALDSDLEHSPSHSHSHGGGHGHSHISDIIQQDFGIRCMLLLAALSIHSLFEGLAMGLQEDMNQLVNLFIGILAHECLVSFAMGVSLAKQRLTVSTMVKLCTIYSAMIPVGMAIGMAIGGIHTFAGNLTSAIVQGVTAGTFVYVIFLEILPSEINDKKDKLWKVLFMFVGFVLIFCLRISMGSEHH